MNDELPDLGPCCCCGESGPIVRNIIMLDKLSPILGHGWGCVLCGLRPNGATYVACDACWDARREPKWACRGYAATEGRVPISELVEPFKHDETRHRQIEEAWFHAGATCPTGFMP